MLVLTRKKGQKLIINDNIEITILDARGDSVKIGINAPREVSIFREEIYEEIKKANEQAQKEILVSDMDKLLNMQNLGKKDTSNDFMKKVQSLTTKIKSDDKK